MHIAIVNQDLDRVKQLCQRAPNLLHRRATGDFFSWSRHVEDRTTSCYYGELPLLFAVSSSATTRSSLHLPSAGPSPEVVDLLVAENHVALCSWHHLTGSFRTTDHVYITSRAPHPFTQLTGPSIRSLYHAMHPRCRLVSRRWCNCWPRIHLWTFMLPMHGGTHAFTWL